MIQKKHAKEYLAESAIELLSKHPVQSITVERISSNCGLSTRTFYNNFKDKYDLFLWIYLRELEKNYQANLDHMSFRSLIRCSGQILLDYKDFFFNYQRYRGQNHFHDSVFQPLLNYFIRVVQEVFHDPITPEIHESLTFFIFGMIEYVDQSYQHGGLKPLDEAVTVFTRAIPENLRKYL